MTLDTLEAAEIVPMQRKVKDDGIPLFRVLDDFVQNIGHGNVVAYAISNTYANR